MKKLFFILTLVLIFSFTISCSQIQRPRQQPIAGVESSISKEGDIQRVRVTANNANIRTGCSPNTPVVQSANKNDSFDVVSKVQDWFAVKMPNNQIGFIPQGQCKPIVVDDNRPEITPSTAGGGAKAPTTAGTAQQIPPTIGTVPTYPSTIGTLPQVPSIIGTAPRIPSTIGTAPQVPPTTGILPQVPSTAGTAPQTGGAPKTPTTQANSTSLTSMEQQMVNLVNQARAQNNLPALQVDMQVTNVARIKAQDMIDNNYFSHNSPKYGSPFDMMKSFGVHFVKAGENIAGNQTVQAAENALMNSPGHRENILSPDYTHIGIGIKKGGPYGNMFSQMFVSKPR